MSRSNQAPPHSWGGGAQRRRGCTHGANFSSPFMGRSRHLTSPPHPVGRLATLLHLPTLWGGRREAAGGETRAPIHAPATPPTRCDRSAETCPRSRRA